MVYLPGKYFFQIESGIKACILALFTFKCFAFASTEYNGHKLAAEPALQITTSIQKGAFENYSPYGVAELLAGSVLFGRKQPNLGGAIWSKQKSSSAEWQIIAKVHLSGGNTGGNGLAFWYTRDGHASGSVFGAPDKWVGLAILLDTYDDDNRGNNPAIMGLLNDGTMSYLPYKDGEGQYFSGCLWGIRNLPQPLQLRITYMSKKLKVELDESSTGQNYVNCFEKHAIDLPEGYYFGISGSTNDYPDSINLQDFQVFTLAASSGKTVPLSTGNQPSEKTVESTVASAEVLETSMSKIINDSLPKIIKDAIQDKVDARLGSVERKIATFHDTLVQIESALAEFKGLLKTQDNTGLFSFLQTMAADFKFKLESLSRSTMQISQEHAALREHVTTPTGFFDAYSGYVFFLLAQVVIMAVFLAVKRRLESTQKKWL